MQNLYDLYAQETPLQMGHEYRFRPTEDAFLCVDLDGSSNRHALPDPRLSKWRFGQVLNIGGCKSDNYVPASLANNHNTSSLLDLHMLYSQVNFLPSYGSSPGPAPRSLNLSRLSPSYSLGDSKRCPLTLPDWPLHRCMRMCSSLRHFVSFSSQGSISPAGTVIR